MIRVYATTSAAPLVDCRGRYFPAANDTELLELVAKWHPVLVEIVIRGTPDKPLAKMVEPLGLQMAWCGAAWGLRGSGSYYCRGRYVEEVLTLRDFLEGV